MNRRIFRSVPAIKRGPVAVLAAAVAAAVSLAVAGCAGSAAPVAPAARVQGTGSATGLGQLSGLLPRDHLTEESAIQVDLSNETVRLPLYPGRAYAGTPHAEKVWYVLLDASDSGLAHDLGVNYAPKLANIAISDPAAVQTVTLGSPTPLQNPFGPAVVNFAGAPDFSPTRIATPGPDGFPLAKFQPGAVPAPVTARSSRSPAPTSSTTRRSWPPATAPST
jgi:hypothetical protein